MLIEQKDGRTIIRLQDNLVAGIAQTVRAELLDMIQNGRTDLVIDMDGVTMIDSAGLGVPIATQNSLDKLQKTLTLVNVAESIQKILKVMRFDKHFEVRA